MKGNVRAHIQLELISERKLVQLICEPRIFFVRGGPTLTTLFVVVFS